MINQFPDHTAGVIIDHFEESRETPVYKVYVHGDRGSGTTTTLVHASIMWASKCANRNVLIAKNNSLGARNIFNWIEDILVDWGIGYSYINEDMVYHLDNGSEIRVVNSHLSLTKIKAMRLDFVIVDNAGLQPKCFVDVVKGGWLAPKALLSDSGIPTISKSEVDEVIRRVHKVSGGYDSALALLKRADDNMVEFVKEHPNLVYDALSDKLLV